MNKSNRDTGMTLLRRRMRAANVPPPRPGNLRIAAWNVRELGNGARLEESVPMIAAIIGTFDVVSIVELRDDLRDFMRILRLLGSRWSAVFSDYVRDAGGNRERVAFAFNRERVTFTGSRRTPKAHDAASASGTCARSPGEGRRSSRHSARAASTSSFSRRTSGGARRSRAG